MVFDALLAGPVVFGSSFFLGFTSFERVCLCCFSWLSMVFDCFFLAQTGNYLFWR